MAGTGQTTQRAPPTAGMTQTMKNTLEARITFFAFILLFLTIFVQSMVGVEGSRREYVNALALRSQSLGASLKENVENVLRLGLDIRDIVGIADKIRALVQANPEIAYCVITDLDGVPLFLNDETFSNLKFNDVTRTLTTSSGRTVNIIVGSDSFYDTVIPLTASDGRPIAQIHAGFSQTIIKEKIQGIVVRSVIILVIFLIITFSLVVVFVRRNIVQPVSTLLTGMQQIAGGALDARIESLPVYEFDELAGSINRMAEFLGIRDEEIKKSYQELEQTHDKLNTSYLKLEDLSLELERSEDLYKSLMEDSSDAIVVIDGNENVKMVNKMAEDFFGYHAREMEGLPLTKLLLLLRVADIPTVHREIVSAVNDRHVNEELSFVSKGGGEILAKFNASCIKSGEERLVQAIFRDVTTEKAILGNLEKSANDLARLNKMKDSFLGLASHELKTPLTVIMGYSELILTEMTPKLDKTVVEMVENIATAATRLDNIIKDMVDVSMIDEQRMTLKLEDISLNQLVEASVNELRFFFSLRKQEIDLHLDDTIPAVRGDSLRLMQLFSNILGNAIKFTPDGGRITVTTSAKYLLRGNQSGSAKQEQCLYVEITFRDTGIGIDRDDQFRIFDKFYEVGNIEEHSSGKVAFKAKGAGLGLTIAKGIVEMHGGEIWVESLGHDPVNCPGSSFHIFLPVMPPLDDTTLNYINILT
jgi:PAS domain S-box-containing protein